MSELKPCPHCGTHKAKVVPRQPSMYYATATKDRYRVYCYECHTFTALFKTEQEAIAAWNRRPAPHKYTVEELREMEGQPYYEVNLRGGDNKWRILEHFIAEYPEDYGYGKTWLAYDRPPEEAQNET